MPAAAPLDVLFFELRGLRCALPLAVVRKVLPMPPLTMVPLAPTVVRGIAPMQGWILPILDLSVCFQPGGDEAASSISLGLGKDKVLLVETVPDASRECVRAGLAVDRVITTATIDEQHSRPPPPRPSFLSATVVDASGPALLFDVDRTVDFVRDAISAVTGP